MSHPAYNMHRSHEARIFMIVRRPHIKIFKNDVSPHNGGGMVATRGQHGIVQMVHSAESVKAVGSNA